MRLLLISLPNTYRYIQRVKHYCIFFCNTISYRKISTHITLTEQQFLELNIFKDIPNLNKGCDAKPLWHFSADDFNTVIGRVEEFKIRILGIECWKDDKLVKTNYCEDYEDTIWHRAAYADLRLLFYPCDFVATYEVPPAFLRE